MTLGSLDVSSQFTEALKNTRQAVDDLRKFVDDNDSQIRETLAKVDLKSTDLDAVIYGNARQDTPGLLKRVQTLEKLVEEIERGRAEQKATLKGIQIGLTLTGAAGVGTLITVLTQILGG
jgi:HEAT repeat protein